MNKLWKPALLSIAVIIMAIGMINSGAWWTDQAATQTQTIQSGELELGQAGFSNFKLGPIANMAPGDLTNEVSIIIKNTGTIDLTWFGNLVVGNSKLKDVIYINYAKMEFLKPGGTDTWLAEDVFIEDGKGIGWYDGNTEDADGYVTLAVFDGHDGNIPGTDYEFYGALKPGYQYKLTLQFGFKPEAGNEYQKSEVTPLDLSFAVDAHQINLAAMNAANPPMGTWYDTMVNLLKFQ